MSCEWVIWDSGATTLVNNPFQHDSAAMRPSVCVPARPRGIKNVFDGLLEKQTALCHCSSLRAIELHSIMSSVAQGNGAASRVSARLVQSRGLD